MGDWCVLCKYKNVAMTQYPSFFLVKLTHVMSYAVEALPPKSKGLHGNIDVPEMQGFFIYK